MPPWLERLRSQFHWTRAAKNRAPWARNSIDMCELLKGGPCKLNNGDVCLKKPDREALKKTRECLLVERGQYAKLIQRLRNARITEPVCEKQTKINGLFGVPNSRKSEAAAHFRREVNKLSLHWTVILRISAPRTIYVVRERREREYLRVEAGHQQLLSLPASARAPTNVFYLAYHLFLSDNVRENGALDQEPLPWGVFIQWRSHMQYTENFCSPKRNWVSDKM